MTTVFISYRRDDSVGHAGRLFDRLAASFGRDRVFRDLDTLAAGEDFVQAVRERVRRSDVLLALIGPLWLRATDTDGRWRLADENDLVRIEIASALQRNTRVIPVLVQGAAMPKPNDLPAELGALARRNAVEIRDSSFDRDVALLIEILGPGWRHVLARWVLRPGVYAGVAAAAALGAGIWAYTQIAMGPEKTRMQIVQMGMAYDADTFVARARAGDLQGLKLFLRAGMAVDSADRNGVNALQESAAKGELPMLQLLLDHGADAGKGLPWAAGHGQREAMRLLLQRKPDLAALNHALHNAAGGPHLDILQTLLDAGADVNAVRTTEVATALTRAAGNANEEQVKLLLARGADVNLGSDRGWTPLLSAIDDSSTSGDEQRMAQRVRVVDLLLDKGAMPEARQRSMVTWQPTALLLAIHNKATPLALRLIERGADVNAHTGSLGGSPRQLSALMWASGQGLTEVVRALLDNGADVEWRNEFGNSALSETAVGDNRAAQAAVGQLLLDAGAQANAANVNRRTSLMLAARQVYGVGSGFIELLLDHGAQVDAVDKDGRSALMYACESGQIETARQLIERGASASARDPEGLDAMAIAKKHDHKDIVKLLAAKHVPAR